MVGVGSRNSRMYGSADATKTSSSCLALVSAQIDRAIILISWAWLARGARSYDSCFLFAKRFEKPATKTKRAYHSIENIQNDWCISNCMLLWTYSNFTSLVFFCRSDTSLNSITIRLARHRAVPMNQERILCVPLSASGVDEYLHWSW